jgi:hypothetical protein
MKLHEATLAKGGLAIKFIILIETSGTIPIITIELIFKFKSKLNEK